MVVLLLLILIALGVSALFIWGVWKILRTPLRLRKERSILKKLFSLERQAHNPILTPSSYDFEREAVMNPAAVHDGEKTHLFYRAIGADGVSRVGYASSVDGMHIDERLPYPVFALEGADPHLSALRRAYAEKHYPELVASGGSWGGTEDPRAVIIDGRMYLSFSAFHSWDSVRIGMTSIDVADLKAKRWKWSRPSFLSPQNQVHKNWLLFPKKLNGKFAIMHSISPKVEVEFRDNIEEIGRRDPYIQSRVGARVNIVDSKSGFWHNRMRGPAAPPIKTPFGWLLFYHAMQHDEPHKYKLGAMLLDNDDPTKVIARSPVPVLEPEAHYETSGAKPGIVYASGTTVVNDKLTVYYGAADNYVCAATAPLSEFVMRLFEHKPVKLSPYYV
jgi:predicted GH43/DUF377 family glycosyl hydrolase